MNTDGTGVTQLTDNAATTTIHAGPRRGVPRIRKRAGRQRGDLLHAGGRQLTAEAHEQSAADWWPSWGK